MISRLGLALCLLVAPGACLGLAEDEARIIEVDTIAGSPTRLRVPAVPVEAVSYRWEVSLAPVTRTVVPPAPEAFGTFTPPLRGEYWVDRLAVLGVSEDLTHRFIVHAGPSDPVAIATVERSIVAVGDIVRIDGSKSFSPEDLPLNFKWEVLVAPGTPPRIPPAPTAEFFANTPGDYTIQLTVTESYRSVRARVIVTAE